MRCERAQPLAGRLRVLPLLAAVWLAAGACRYSSIANPNVHLRYDGRDASTAAIEMSGLTDADVASLRERDRSADEWHAIMRVVVARDGDGDVTPPADIPPVAGTYTVTDRGLLFTPAFGLDPGRRYAVTVNFPPGRHVTNIVSVPRPPMAAATRVDRIYPSSDVVPENLLRMYVQFSAPMGRRSGIDHIRLVDAAGREVKEPFLPLDGDFWNADRTRFTLFFDPGRVKRGILPNEQMGRALRAGEQYTLIASRDWLDAQGLPLREEARRSFRAGPADLRPLDPKTWRIAAPPGGTREAVVVSFPEPLDHGLLMRALGVTMADGAAVTGEPAIDEGETRWRFTPAGAWRAGDYRVVAATILEDLAGNRIGRAFDVDRFDRVDRDQDVVSVSVPFRIPR